MTIYKATNISNNKIYIGKTKRNLKTRIREHYRDRFKSACKNTYFYNALKKYPIENIVWEEIDSANNLDELSKKETYWINHLESYKRDKGYNIKIGDTVYGVEKLSDNERDAIAVKLGQTPFIVFDNNGNEVIRGVNVSRISKKLNINISGLSDCLHNKYSFCKNYTAIYEHEFTQELLKLKLDRMHQFKKNSVRGKEFDVYKKDTNEFIGSFNSAKIAATTLNINNMSHIEYCLKGINKSAGGYIFKLKS